MPKKPDNKIIIAVSVTVFIALLSGWLVIFLLGGKVKKSFEDFQKEKLNFVVLEEKKKKIMQMKKEFPNLEEEKNNLDSMLIKKEENVPFLRALEKIADDSSCSIKIEPADLAKIKFEKKAGEPVKKTDDLDTDTAAKNSPTQTTPEQSKKEDDLAPLKNFPAFVVEISGHYSSVIDFFNGFENMPYFVRPLIVDISVPVKKGTTAAEAGTLSSGTSASPNNQNQDEKSLKMTMTFVIYGN